MPGKSGKEAFSWGKRGRLGWFRRKLLQETEMEKLETLKDLSRSVPFFFRLCPQKSIFTRVALFFEENLNETH